MGMPPPRLLRPQRTYAGEVCPECGYPMNYSINQTCEACGTFHLLPFDSLLIGHNWKPKHPYDVVSRPPAEELLDRPLNHKLEIAVNKSGKMSTEEAYTAVSRTHNFRVEYWFTHLWNNVVSFFIGLWPDSELYTPQARSNTALLVLMRTLENEIEDRRDRLSAGYTVQEVATAMHMMASAKPSLSEYMEPYQPTYTYGPQAYTPLLEDEE